MTDTRLIETLFPLRQTSIDAVHEKNVRHGHISTLHIWPARRPLAASRAVLLATLLRDPDDPRARRALLQRMAGRLVDAPDAAGGRMKQETRGGILHWGREDDSAAVEAFRREVRDAFGGRAPRVLDPFAGGGAIPLEAMRLGCEVTAADLNPVAWFILRCTLHYPRLLAGKTRPLPAFAVRDRVFVTAFLQARGAAKPRDLQRELAKLGHLDDEPAADGLDGLPKPPSPAETADLAWHLRAWGRRVLDGARRTLAARYPTYAEFEPAVRKGRRRTARPAPRSRPRRPPRRLEPDAEGRVSTAALNAEFDSLYLEQDANPRWVAKPVVAYLWARTVRCAACRAEVPLLKTRWLCKKGPKRVRLAMTPRADRSGVEFDVETDVPEGPGAAARRREHNQRLGGGTMSRSGATCPCCGAIATTEDIRAAGRAGRLGVRMTAVVVDGQRGKEYRRPAPEEVEAARVGRGELDAVYGEVPFGPPDEAISPDRPSSNARGASGLPRYGFDRWSTIFTDRQLLALGTFVREIRRCAAEMDDCPAAWREALTACLAPSISRLADRGCALAVWQDGPEKLGHAFARFALPMVWDFAESCPLSDTTGGFGQAVEWIARVVEHATAAAAEAPAPRVALRSAAVEPEPGGGSTSSARPTSPRTGAQDRGRAGAEGRFDLVCTDPPYYDAIPYSDLMDFFHVWLRRTLHGLSPEVDAAFVGALGPKWDAERGDGELVDQPSRFGSDRAASRRAYEDGMFRAFGRCRDALAEDGRLVVVFANKQPDAWETLVSALVRAGFIVTASWPIQTERPGKVAGGARLASSIWLVCRKRPADARAGWHGPVLAEMRAKITGRLRDFWDAGIRGPDFVWAATGPALEAFSRYPVVKRSDAAGRFLTVAEFLRRVRRMVVGFVVSRLLAGDDAAAGELDDVTTWYLLHRTDFGFDPAPAGACILYALSCNLSDADLAGGLDLLARGGRTAPADEDDAEDADDSESGAGGDSESGAGGDSEFGAGGDVRLKPWHRRRARGLGEPAADGAAPPLVDCVHALMQRWKTGEQSRVDAYLEERGLWRHELFARVVQALIELADAGSDERATLESIQNHLRARDGAPALRQLPLP